MGGATIADLAGAAYLGLSTLIFLFAASAAKAWTLTPTMWRLALVLALYSLGNLVMLRLIRDFGMGVALSLSGVIQLLAVNAIALRGLWRESKRASGRRASTCRCGSRVDHRRALFRCTVVAPYTSEVTG